MGAIGMVLLQMLIRLALQFGMAWLAKRFPWLTPEQTAAIAQHVSEVKESREKCLGAFCPTDLVKD